MNDREEGIPVQKAAERSNFADQNIATRRKTSTLHPILCFEQLSNQTGTGSFKILTGQKQRVGLRTRLLSQPTHLLPLGRLQSSSARQPIRDVPNLEHLCSTNGNTDLRQRNILTNKTTSGDTNHETHDEHCTRQYQSYGRPRRSQPGSTPEKEQLATPEGTARAVRLRLRLTISANQDQ